MFTVYHISRVPGFIKPHYYYGSLFGTAIRITELKLSMILKKVNLNSYSLNFDMIIIKQRTTKKIRGQKQKNKNSEEHKIRYRI